MMKILGCWIDRSISLDKVLMILYAVFVVIAMPFLALSLFD